MSASKREGAPADEQPPAKKAKGAEDAVEVPPRSVMVSTTAGSNLAVVKYWGKADTDLVLPVASSLSATLSLDVMASFTTAVASRDFAEDSMALNGEQVPLNARLRRVLDLVRAGAGDLVCPDSGKTLVAKADWPQFRVRITSRNNFPTAAGLASSASGLACFTKCLAELFAFRESFPGELTTVARQGSGSACRSMYGGWVAWQKGERADGTDSIAVQHFPESHWPEMRALVLVVSAGAKDVSSTSGMQRTVDTSEFLKHRADALVEPRMAAMRTAVAARDFETFGKLTMRDSNQFHSTCLDTYPPIFYLNGTSAHIIRVVHAINAAAGRVVAAYTFDAGPNAVVFCLDKDMDGILATFLSYYVPEANAADPAPFVTDPLGLADAKALASFRDRALVGEDAVARVPNPENPVRRVIVTKVGEGAKLLERRHTF